MKMVNSFHRVIVKRDVKDLHTTTLLCRETRLPYDIILKFYKYGPDRISIL